MPKVSAVTLFLSWFQKLGNPSLSPFPKANLQLCIKKLNRYCFGIDQPEILKKRMSISVKVKLKQTNKHKVTALLTHY